MELEETVRIETAGHVIEGHIIVGTVRQVFIGGQNDKSRLVIYDELDEQIKNVLVSTQIFREFTSLGEARRALEGARIILASRSYKINLGSGKTIDDVVEIINVLNGQLAGHLLVFQNKPVSR